MKIGLVGYKGSGKTALFQWLTGVAADPALSHTGQSAMAPVPDPRIEALAKLYNPKKITRAALDSSTRRPEPYARGQRGPPGRAPRGRLPGAGGGGLGGADPLADLQSFDEDLILADMEIISGRLQRLEESLRKPRSKLEREQTLSEQAILQGVMTSLEAGKPMRESELPDEHRKVTRAFRLFSEKPRMVIVNTADDESDPQRFTQAAPPDVPLVAIPSAGIRVVAHEPGGPGEFEKELGVGRRTGICCCGRSWTCPARRSSSPPARRKSARG